MHILLLILAWAILITVGLGVAWVFGFLFWDNTSTKSFNEAFLSIVKNMFIGVCVVVSSFLLGNGIAIAIIWAMNYIFGH